MCWIFMGKVWFKFIWVVVLWVMFQNASPACTELETITLDWLGRMIGLPDQFLPFSKGGIAGAVIQVWYGVKNLILNIDKVYLQVFNREYFLQSSASECILVNMLAARQAVIQKALKANPFEDEANILSKLTAYCSREVM